MHPTVFTSKSQVCLAIRSDTTAASQSHFLHGKLSRARTEKDEKTEGSLQSINLPQLRLQLGAQGRQVRVAANVLCANEDVGDGALAGDLLEGRLEVVAVLLLVQLVDLD